jgi:hypothetical protein
VYAYTVIPSTTNTVPVEDLNEVYVFQLTPDGDRYRVANSIAAWADDLYSQPMTSAQQQMFAEGWIPTGRDVQTIHSDGSSTYMEEVQRFVNLTPHAVTIYGPDDQTTTTIPTSGTVARLAETTEPSDAIGAIPTVTVHLGQVDGLPAAEDGTTYVVSMPLLMGMAAAGIDRPDCVYPFGQVRDAQGRIIGCRQLARIAH